MREDGWSKVRQRRKRDYKLTREDQVLLRTTWQSFVAAINRMTGVENA